MERPIRPSRKELTRKIHGAIRSLCRQEGLFAEPGKIAPDLNALGVGDSSDVWPLIGKLLLEIKPENYAGTKPRQKAYEKSIEGSELFAFSWDSGLLGRRMYLKFVLKKNDRFVCVSLHEERLNRERKSNEVP